jgi:hypothetical protein
MRFNRLDHVKRDDVNPFWDGLVCGSVELIDGREVIIVQRHDTTIFVCTESQLQIVRPHKVLPPLSRSEGVRNVDQTE